jgi:hypothetical protein
MAQGVGGAPAPQEGLGSIGRDVAQDVLALVRAEIAFARAQMLDALKRMIIGAVLLIVALLFLFIALIEALGALPSELGPSLFHSRYWGWLVLAGLLVLLALVLALIGYGRIRKSIGEGKDTVNALKEDGKWLRHLTKRASSGS